MSADRAPRRIRLSRAKGWRKPEGAVVVARPSRWGNPFRVGDENPVTGDPIRDRDEAVDMYRSDLAMLQALNPDGYAAVDQAIRAELAGRDLACWCPLDQPCHADVLLDIANGPRS